MLKAVVDQGWLTWKLLFDKRVPVWMKVVAIAPLIYVISPIDIIPDVFLGLGQLDDIGIVLAGMRLFESLVPADIVAEHRSTIKRADAADTVEGTKYTVRSEKPKRS
jgi:uncharacterized membrane protein YkvA (DUF1232 family)